MQPLGIIVFSCIMGTLGFQILIEGVRQLMGPDHTHHLEDLYAVIGVMVFVIAVKFFLWLYCRRSNSVVVQTYAQDHRNDVVTNSVGLVSAMLGDRMVFWIDPFGAILLAVYIIYNWAETAIEQIKAMVGVSAPPEFLTQLTYLAWNHHPEIICIDTVRAYTFGPNFFVEVDIVLAEEMKLKWAEFEAKYNVEGEKVRTAQAKVEVDAAKAQHEMAFKANGSEATDDRTTLDAGDINSRLGQVNQLLVEMSQGMAQARDSLTRPKEIVRDDNGKIIGAQ